MKAFSLWLFKLCWRREIATVVREREAAPGMSGTDYAEGVASGIDCALETLHLKEPK